MGFIKSLYLCFRECQIAAASPAVFKDIINSLISEPDVFSLLKERKIPYCEEQDQYFYSLLPFYRQSFLLNLEDFRTLLPSGLSFQINSTFCASETIVWGRVCLFCFLILEIKALMMANIAPSASPFVRNSFFVFHCTPSWNCMRHQRTVQSRGAQPSMLSHGTCQRRFG